MQLQPFDESYIRRLTNSDPRTEGEFVSYFGNLLSIKLRSRLRTGEEIDDVTQETFFRVFSTLRREGIDNPAALGAFVNSVCNKVLFERYRKTREAEIDSPRIDQAGAIGDGSHYDVEEDVEEDEEVRAEVRAVLGQLPEKDREILRLLFIENRDGDEIGRALGVEREHLRVLIHRAKFRFRAALLAKRKGLDQLKVKRGI